VSPESFPSKGGCSSAGLANVEIGPHHDAMTSQHRPLRLWQADRMERIADRYRRLSAGLAQTVASVPADSWECASPCEGWNAADVLDHLIGSQGMFLELIGRTIEPGPSVRDDAAGAWATATAQVQAALDDPEIATTEFVSPFFGPTSFEASIEKFVCFDLAVHRWDLATATGLDATIDPDDIEWVSDAASAFGDMLHSPGVCGPALETTDDADPQTRMLAMLGRRA
jgi:uncharacterized protein (TIGR03086 family)